MSNLGGVLSKASVLKRFTDGGLGRRPQPPVAMGVWRQSPQLLDDFCKFLENKAI